MFPILEEVEFAFYSTYLYILIGALRQAIVCKHDMCFTQLNHC